jgi:hypothetical protein
MLDIPHKWGNNTGNLNIRGAEGEEIVISH